MKAKKQERVQRKFICDYIVRLDHSPEVKRHKSPSGREWTLICHHPEGKPAVGRAPTESNRPNRLQ